MWLVYSKKWYSNVWSSDVYLLIGQLEPCRVHVHIPCCFSQKVTHINFMLSWIGKLWSEAIWFYIMLFDLLEDNCNDLELIYWLCCLNNVFGILVQLINLPFFNISWNHNFYQLILLCTIWNVTAGCFTTLQSKSYSTVFSEVDFLKCYYK